jgi:thiol-disulfide isomerase/thioredoxin
MRISNLSGLVLLGLLLSAGARGAELLYFFSPSCGYCKAFDEEVGKIYPQTDAGHIAPLRRVEVDPESFQPLERGLSIDPGTVPAFILVDDGQEVARLNGYSGDELFWMSMQRMLDMLEQ